MSLSDLKRRITAVKNTNKITKAISLISAAQLHKVKHVLSVYQNYYHIISQISAAIAFNARQRFDSDVSKISINDDLVIQSCKDWLGETNNNTCEQKNLTIVISSDKGLCGSFNSSLVNFVAKMYGESEVVCIGQKGYEMLLSKKGVKLAPKPSIEVQAKNIANKTAIDKVTRYIVQLISSNLYKNITIVYTEFISMLKQQVVSKQLFPLVLDCHDAKDIAFDRKPLAMLNDIIPQYIGSIVYYAIIHSLKSETVKRMMTMDSASRNSKTMMDDLSLEYNRARQTKVTMELIEVISGVT